MTWAIIKAFALKNWQAILLGAVVIAVLTWGLRGYSLADKAERARAVAEQEAVDRTLERDKARAERAAALDAAETCSASVAALKAEADKRHESATPARQQAASQARQHQQRAAAILATPPSVPGDDAASAQARIDAWIATRGDSQ